MEASSCHHHPSWPGSPRKGERRLAGGERARASHLRLTIAIGMPGDRGLRASRLPPANLLHPSGVKDASGMLMPRVGRTRRDTSAWPGGVAAARRSRDSMEEFRNRTNGNLRSETRNWKLNRSNLQFRISDLRFPFVRFLNSWPSPSTLIPKILRYPVKP